MCDDCVSISISSKDLLNNKAKVLINRRIDTFKINNRIPSHVFGNIRVTYAC